MGLFSNLPGSKPGTGMAAPLVSQLQRDKESRVQAEEEQKVKDNTSVRDLIGAAAVDGTVGYIARAIGESKVRSRTGEAPFFLTDDHFKRFREHGIDESQWELFERATNEEHLQFLEGIAFENMEVQKTRAQFGMFANMAADMTDPGMAALDVVATPLAMLGTGTRLVRGVKAGAYASAMGVTATAMQGAYNPEVGAEEMLEAAATNFILGGAIGTVLGGSGKPHAEADNVKPVYDAVSKDYLDQNLSAAHVDGIAPDATPGLTPLRTETSEETARLGTAILEKDIRVAFAPVRRDLSARLGNMKSPLTRLFGRKAVRDGVGYTDRNLAVETSASELSKRHSAVLDANFREGINSGWDEYVQANGKNALSKTDFYAEVGRAVRGDTTVSPEAYKASAKVIHSINQTLKVARDNGLNGFADIIGKENFLPRTFSPEGFTKLFGEKGLVFEDVLEQVVKPAMLREWEKKAPAISPAKLATDEATFKDATVAQEKSTAKLTKLSESIDELDAKIKRFTAEGRNTDKHKAKLLADKERLKKLQESHKELVGAEARAADVHLKNQDLNARQAVDMELLHEVATAWLRRGQRVLEGSNEDYFIKALHLNDLKEVEKLLLDNGAPAAKVHGILERLKARADLNDTNPHARPRVDIDENFKAMVKTADGREVEVRFSDLLENDVEKLIPAFNKEIAGWSALNNKLGVQNQTDLDALKRQVLEQAKAHGDDVDATGKMFDITTKSIRGMSTEADPLSFGSRMARVIGGNNFITSMGQVGFSMVSDFGTVLAYGGFRNTLKSIPAISDIVRLARNGQMDDKVSKILNEFFAPGTAWLNTPAFYREVSNPTSLGYGSSGMTQKVLNGLDNATEKGKHYTSVLSGMAPIHTMYQRIAARANLMTLMDLAKSGKITPAQQRRLRNYGLDEKAQASVFEFMKKFDSIDKIDTNGIDFHTRESMANYLSRATKHQILEGDVGDSLELMHSSLGKLVFQFRTFMNTSYTRHFLYSWNNLDDWRSYAMLVTTAAMAGGGWAVRTYLNTIGDEEQRKKMLTEENFVTSAIQQSVWSAYIPLVVDTYVADIRGNDPVFRYGRSSGFESGISGNPTYAKLNALLGGGRALADAISGDREVSQKQANDLWKLVWFNNLTGVRNVGREAIEAVFPEDDGDRAEIREEQQDQKQETPLPFLGE